MLKNSYMAYYSSIILLCFLLSCTPAPTPPAQTEKVTVAYMNLALASLFHIARVQGFFHQEGVEVIAQPHIYGVGAVESLINGQADLAISADTPFVLAVMNGNKLSLPASIASSDKYNVIIARKDRGILRPADLRGKVVGVVKGSTAHFFLHSFLVTQGLSHKNAVIRNYPPGEPIRNAIITGEADAISYWSNAAQLVERALGDTAIFFHDEALYSDNACLIAQQDFARTRPDTIRKVLRALIRAESYVRKNHDAARKTAAAFTGIEQGVFDSAWRTITFRVSLHAELLVSLEDQSRWAWSHGLVQQPKVPDYTDLFMPELLRSVKPDAVRLF